jgi:hypothetical protein
MRRKIAFALGVLTVLAGLAYGLYRYYYPLGREHRCDKALWFVLVEYGEKHGGAFPSGQATPEASLSLVHSLDPSGSEYSSLLHRRDVSADVVRQILQGGQLLGPNTCGWEYVEGLRLDSNPSLALFWDKEGLGHNGERLSGGGHVVTFVDGRTEHIPAARWQGFLAQQRVLRTQELRKDKGRATGLEKATVTTGAGGTP